MREIRIRHRGQEIESHTHLQPFEVVANQRRIEQVIVNFLTNAIRYTPERQAIIVSTLDKEDTVQVCIENKGAHIPDEQLEKIWDRFYRGEPSRQRASGGTGLGLAISKKILDLHGVPYGVTNTAEGVMFYFHLHKKGRECRTSVLRFLLCSRTGGRIPVFVDYQAIFISSAFYLYLSLLFCLV